MKDSPPVGQPTNSAPLRSPPNSAPLVQSAGAAPQIQYVTYQVNGPTSQGEETGLGVTVRTLGIIALCFMVVGFIPCLGWLNYLNLALSFITIIIGIVAMATGKSDADRTAAIIGVAFVGMAIVLGIGRLILGGGCL